MCGRCSLYVGERVHGPSVAEVSCAGKIDGELGISGSDILSFDWDWA